MEAAGEVGECVCGKCCHRSADRVGTISRKTFENPWYLAHLGNARGPPQRYDVFVALQQRGSRPGVCSFAVPKQKGERGIPNGSDQANLGSGFSPSYSPSGDQIVFMRFAGDEERDLNQDIWVVNDDGSGAKQVTAGRAYEFSPTS